MSDTKPLASIPVAHRKRARRMVVQALYQWHLSGGTASQILNEFSEDNDLKNVDVNFLSEALNSIAKESKPYDAQILEHLDRAIGSVDPIELSILRLAAFELSERLDIPYRVVINESIELAKQFGGTDGHKFVNGIVDKLSADLRATEVQADTKLG